MKWNKLYRKYRLLLFARNSYLNLNTIKSCALTGYNDSRRDLSKCLKTTTCQLTHGWWVESNWSVIRCGLPRMLIFNLSVCYSPWPYIISEIIFGWVGFFRNACTKSGSLRFSQFSGCWLILSVYILMSFDFPFVRLFGVQ